MPTLNTDSIGTWDEFPPARPGKFGPVTLDRGDAVEVVAELPVSDATRWVVVTATTPDGRTVFAPVAWGMLDHGDEVS